MRFINLVRSIPMLKYLDIEPREGEIRFLDTRIIVIPADALTSLFNAITEIVGENITNMFMRRAGLKTGVALYSAIADTGLAEENLETMLKKLAEFITLSGWGKFYVRGKQIIGENLVSPKFQHSFIKGLIEGFMREAKIKGNIKVKVSDEKIVIDIET